MKDRGKNFETQRHRGHREEGREKRAGEDVGNIVKVGRFVRRIAVQEIRDAAVQEIRDALGSLGEERVSAQSPVLFVFGRLARS